ncbi:MAG: AAA family ATPase [Kiritimatiellae bacterium]|nr:AAA family ATPase [Kiritimatiellia bacterium]
MEEPRPILYGVSDYARIRRKNAWFVDRTAKLRDLEKVAYAMFLRPRRFGKSLLCSILRAYYDIQFADRFDEFFSGTDIGANPTDEHGRYLILYFNFSAVSKDVREVEASFNDYAALCIDTFAKNYRDTLPEGVAEEILSAPGCIAKLSRITQGLMNRDMKLYVLIDEYDNFTNTILAESGLNAYNDLCHGDGFFKQFFTSLKDATTGTEAPVTRLFITGVSPVTMDDVTSGFNVGTNISLWPQFADLTGFGHDDIHAMASYYGAICSFDAAKAEQVCLDWFDNYRFGDADAPPVANTTLVLNFFNQIVNGGKWPDNYIDANLRTDYAKIRHLVTLGHRIEVSERRLNGNFGILEKLVSGGSLSEPLIDSFQAKTLNRKENFTSLLYWLGITTIAGNSHGRPVFGVPNETLKKLVSDMIPAAYADVHKIDERVYDLNDALYDFAFEGGDWRPFVDILSGIVKENFAVRDSIDGEKTVQSTIVALLVAAAGPYFIRHEGEAGGGFYDIAMKPRLLDWPDIAHAAIIELKYLKPGGRKPTKTALAAIKAEAIEQLDRYSADPALVAKWRLKPVESPTANLSTFQPFNLSTDGAGGSVSLHRLVVVFQGGDRILADEA